MKSLAEALQKGQMRILTGPQAVSVGGDVQDAVIVTGNGNVVTIFKEDNAETLRRLLAEAAPRPPDEELIRAYLEEVAKQKPYVLWTDQTYIAREVARREEAPFYPRYAARYDPRAAVGTGLGPVHPAQDKPEPLERALEREARIVLVGEPGIGKTTSLLHLAWERARHALEGQVSDLLEGQVSDLLEGQVSDLLEGQVSDLPQRAEIPIYVELKYYEGGELETLLARRLNALLRPRGLTLAHDEAGGARILKAWLLQAGARFLLLPDGLNEVRPEFQTNARAALEALLGYPQRMVISCRERDYDESLRDQAAAFLLQGLGEDEISDYLGRVLGEKGAELFNRQIRWDEKMRTLAANPLMLWLIGVAAQDDPEARLPANRGKLFQQFAAAMPGLRRTEGFPPKVPPDVIETALARLACEMLERGELAVDLGQARAWEIPTAGRPLEEALAQAKDWRFLKSDGFAGEPVEFLHQLFQEYFAAVQLNLQLSTSNFQPAAILGERPFQDEWFEPIAMLAGICERPAELVKWLGAQVVERKHGHAAFLVLRCWETSEAAADPETRHVVIDALIAALGDAKAWVREGAAEALGRIGDARAVEPLIAALGDANEWARAGAAWALGEIGDAQAVEALIAALQDEDENVRWDAAWALGKIGDPRALPALERMAREDQVGSVAEAAREASEQIRKRLDNS